MRIGLVSPYALDVPGGVQAQVLGLSEVLTRRGHETTVVGPKRVLRVRANGSLAPVGVGGVGEALEGVDVVHVHEPVLPFGLAALGDRPTVATFHADPPGWAIRAIRATAPAIRSRLEGAVLTAVSEVASAPWRAIGLDPVIIPNGVSLPRTIDAGERGGHRVVFVGRDDPRKDLGRLLAAWPRVRGELPDAELVVVGAEADGAGVIGLGRVAEDEKWQRLASASVLCAPNTGGESFGIVLVEAMASGCAVLCADLPAFRATVGEAGAFLAPGDDLAGHLANLLRDAEYRKALAGAGLQRARRFDWETIGDQYLAMYVRALD